MPYKYGKRTREFLGAFLFPFQSSFPRFSGVFNKTIIPLALVGYEMIRWLSIISYPTRARGIIVKYTSLLSRRPFSDWLLYLLSVL